MNLSDQYHDVILKEFHEVEKHWNESGNYADKLYFFSASFGIINRVMNLQYDPLLGFMHQVLNGAHQAMSQRLSSYSQTKSGDLPQEMMDALMTCFLNLRNAFEVKNDDSIRKVLQELSNLTYATTGNGFYLYLKGDIVLSSQS